MSIFAKQHFEFQFPPTQLNKKIFSFEHHQGIVRPRNISHQVNPVGPRVIIRDLKTENKMEKQIALSQKFKSSMASNQASDYPKNKYIFQDILSQSSVRSNQEDEASQVSQEKNMKVKLDDNRNQLKRRVTVSTSPDTSQSKQKQTKNQINFQDFKIIDFLGKGSFSEVYLVFQAHLRFLCVLKIINKEKVKQMKCQQMIIREIKLQVQLNHPNIVRSYGYFSDRENIYIIQQYVGQKNLQKVLKKKGPLQEKKVKSIIRQICKGVQYLHNLDILHRDLKLENILNYQGTVKICDFGCAVQTTVPRYTMVGTLPYLSPQQVKYERYGKKKDVWSIGIMTHQLLFAYSPFERQIVENLFFPLGQRRFSKLNIDKLKQQSKQAIDFLQNILQQNEIIRLTIQQVVSHSFLND